MFFFLLSGNTCISVSVMSIVLTTYTHLSFSLPDPFFFLYARYGLLEAIGR